METSVEESDDIVRVRRQVDEYLDNSREEREWAELHRDYFDDKQWTASEIATLTTRGQPIITDNKIKDKVLYMMGVEQKTRSDPKAYPRTPVHEEDADVATDAIRYVFDENRLQITKSVVFQNLLIEGFGGAEVIVDKEDPQRIIIRKIRWDRLYRDPYSLEPDCSDAMYIGVITWMDDKRARERWPGKGECIAATSSSPRNSGDSIDDKPKWVDAKRKRVQVFEHYERKKGNIYRSVFCWGGFLEDQAECVYVDDRDRHEWPLVVASAYVDRDGRRYGLVRRYIGLQDEVNKRRSKSMHLLSTKQILAERGAFVDGSSGNGVDYARQQLHRSDGVIEYTPGMKVEIQSNLDLSAGHFQLLQQAENALSVTGPNAALLGQSGAISGRAKMLDQQGGALSVGTEFDVIRDWQLRIARAVWNRIRQFWTEEMMIRVTDTEAGIKFVALNKPMTQGEMYAKKLKGQPPDQVQAQLQAIAQDPMAQQPALDEQGRQIKQNDVAQLDVDISIDEAPDVITLQAEEFEKLTQLAGTGMVQIPPEVLIEASQFRSATKKRISDILKGADDPQAQMKAQFAEMMTQLEGLLKQAEVRKTEADAGLAEAKTTQIQTGAVTQMATALSPDPSPMAKGPQKAQAQSRGR